MGRNHRTLTLTATSGYNDDSNNTYVFFDIPLIKFKFSLLSALPSCKYFFIELFGNLNLSNKRLEELDTLEDSLNLFETLNHLSFLSCHTAGLGFSE